MRAYYDPQAHSVSTGSQAALACGLYFGLVPEEDRAAVLENLVRAVESMQYRQTTGEVCFRYLVQSLADGGRSDIVYRVINRTDPPSYGCMLTQYNLKTLSEQWDKPGSSLNHCMFGHIQEWFQAYLLGIRQADSSVGFERVQIAPTPVGDVDEAEGFFDGPRGRIDVKWTRSAETFSLDVTIPADTMADVVFPKGTGTQIRESGNPVQEAEGTTKVETTDLGTVASLGPGTYSFVCSKS
jgi:hypothetical protein